MNELNILFCCSCVVHRDLVKITLWDVLHSTVSVVVRLTGITRSKQTLKFFFWSNFSFFKATRVSPINSLCPNLSSSLTESLKTDTSVP